ncbi:MAG: hypothetical protein CFK52_01155 [Chloracidobacterium sp. CP2_5A]|nr:MAG: hypothetical protein CFK52_01155 [Chloracidobacterium sp. CP2_5A]
MPIEGVMAFGMRKMIWLFGLASWLFSAAPPSEAFLGRRVSAQAASQSVAALPAQDDKKDDKKKEPRYLDKKPKDENRKDDRKEDKRPQNG